MKISITYDVKWQLNGNNKYKLATSGEVINTKTFEIINKTKKGSQVGYYIDGTFTPKSKFEWVKIPAVKKCPFGSQNY